MTDTALNELETVLHEGSAGRATAADLHAAVLQATLFVPSVSEVGADGSFTPLLLPTPRSETGMILAFTDRRRITPEVTAQAPHIFEVAGTRLIRHLAPDRGIVIFAGLDAAAELDPATLADLRLSIYR